METRLSLEELSEKIESLFKKSWQFDLLKQDDSLLLFAQKGGWTRLGAYIIHLGVIVVLAGSIIGKTYGFSTSVSIPEGVFIKNQRENAPASAKSVERVSHNHRSKALSAIRVRPPDLILLDVELTDGSGLDLINDLDDVEYMPG